MKKRVMVVDDSRVQEVQMHTLLEGTGYEVAAYCRNGEEALACYSEVKPDVVTMDIIMPGMDGLETARALLEEHPEARIVMVSSLAYDETFEEAEDIGAKGFLDKPIDQEKLLAALDKATSKPAPRAAASAGAPAAGQDAAAPAPLTQSGANRTITAANAPAAVGPYCHAKLAGNTLYTSGQLGLQPATGELPEGVEAQAAQAMENLAAVLDAAGMSCADVVKTTVFLADIKDFAAVNEIYAGYFPGEAPARSCVQVAALPKGALFEIEAVAVK